MMKSSKAKHKIKARDDQDKVRFTKLTFRKLIA